MGLIAEGGVQAALANPQIGCTGGAGLWHLGGPAARRPDASTQTIFACSAAAFGLARQAATVGG